MPVKTSTRVYHLNAFDFSKIEETVAELPELGPYDVLLRMRAFSLNYRDYLVASGIYNPRQKFPLIPLSDGAGEVIEIGNAVTAFSPGDRVMPTFMQNWSAGELNASAAKSALGGAIDGVMRREAVFHEQGLVKVPEGFSFEEAATLPCAALTAWNALFESGSLKPGQSVLTLGTGGVSIFALQFAKAAGAQVLITSSSDEKLEKAKILGADHLINYRKTPDWEAASLKAFPNGVDNIIELGGAGTLDRSVKAVRLGGQVSLIGILASGQFNPMPLLMKGVKLQGIFVGSREMFQRMNAAIAANKIKPVIDRVFEVGQIKEALEHMAGGKHFGKIVLRYND